MPSSHYFQINEIVDLIVLTNPDKLLDIGIGFGKFGFLAREYLELWKPEGDYLNREKKIDGIEAFEPYITPIYKYIYNEIFIGNALDVVPTLETRYDLILMIDVFEHFTQAEGIRLLDECRKKSRNILISVPLHMSPQEAVYSNPFEIHKYPWKKNDFNSTRDKFFIRNKRSLICYIGDDSARLEKFLKQRQFREAIVVLLDFLRIKGIVKFLLRME